MVDKFQELTAGGGQITRSADGTIRLTIPPGRRGSYRLAQLDDYHDLPRADFPHRPPLELLVKARLNPGHHPGTWGFGFWNAPLNFALGHGVSGLFPAVPNSAWFFISSPPNHLSFLNSGPGNGFLAQIFRSRSRSLLPAALTALASPLFLFRPSARWLRRWIRERVVQEEVTVIENVDTTTWHEYRITWRRGAVDFMVDGITKMNAHLSPAGPLGAVIWVDNQYARLTPEGDFGFGTLATDHETTLEIRDLKLIQ